jgi:hypothetical protein
MTQKLTPGPWRFDTPEDPANSSIIGADNTLVVAGEYDGWMVPFACGGERAAANAAAILAVPEIVEALQLLESAADDLLSLTSEHEFADYYECKARIEHARAALAEAKLTTD